LVLEFRDQGDHRFQIRVGKNRLTGTIDPDRTFEVVDTDLAGLDIMEVDNPEDDKVREMAEDMAAFILASGDPVSTKQLRVAAGGRKETQTRAMDVLRVENPRRVVDGWEVIQTDSGRQRAKAWRPAPPELEETS
jgi:hypothetical protein